MKRALFAALLVVWPLAARGMFDTLAGWPRPRMGLPR